MAKKLPKGIRKLKSGTYEARAMIKGKTICMYNDDLDALVIAFENAKEEARNAIEYLRNNLTLDNWFYDWFDNVKSHKVKVTSRVTMRNSYK